MPVDQALSKRPESFQSSVSDEFNKSLGRELESIDRRFNDERHSWDAASSAKQDQVLRLICSTLSENVEKNLESGSHCVEQYLDRGRSRHRLAVSWARLDGPLTELTTLSVRLGWILMSQPPSLGSLGSFSRRSATICVRQSLELKTYAPRLRAKISKQPSSLIKQCRLAHMQAVCNSVGHVEVWILEPVRCQVETSLFAGSISFYDIQIHPHRQGGKTEV
jgi:hypothetical protein